MNKTSIYLTKLHNAMQYRNFSHATAGYSIVVSRILAEIADQDLKHAEMFFEAAQEKHSEAIALNPFDIDLQCDAKEYTPRIVDEIITEEKHLAEIFRKGGYDLLHWATAVRVRDLTDLLHDLLDGSLFGHTVDAESGRKDCICTACGYSHRETTAGSHDFPETCPCCGAPQGMFVRRRPHGGWEA